MYPPDGFEHAIKPAKDGPDGCNTPCKGKAGETCGGGWHNTVMRIECGSAWGWPVIITLMFCSALYLGGGVAYANEAKTALLGVDEAMLAENGAVSEPVALAMARGACDRFGADLGISTTGISGPGGGSDEKPVGLVYIALHRTDGPAHCERFVFPLDRGRHRQLTAHTALDWVRRSLLGVELVGPSLMRRQGGASTPGGGAQRG